MDFYREFAILFTLIIAIKVFGSAAASNSSCTTPLQKTGKCIRFEECKPLYDLVLKPPLTSENKKLLTESQCNYINKQVFVCCPNEKKDDDDDVKPTSEDENNPVPQTIDTRSSGTCLNPKNESGECIVLNECEPLYSLLMKPLTTSERNFLSNSQCDFRNNQVFVCCVQGGTKSSGKKANLPQPPVCGRSGLGTKIVGGNVTEIDEYPWMALIEYTKPGPSKGFHCGGALISERYVLTAAHCHLAVPTHYKITGVRLGEWDTTTDPDCITDSRGIKECAPAAIDVAVERIITHPDYNVRTNLHDIALLRLAQPVRFSDFIIPVCLPPITRSTDFKNASMNIAGWGKTETGENSKKKLKATVPGWAFADCTKKYRTANRILEPTQMCAGGETGVDSCKGDSGGPLVGLETVDKRNIFFMLGIVSYGPSNCGSPGWPGVYTVVSKYIDWIENNVEV